MKKLVCLVSAAILLFSSLVFPVASYAIIPTVSAQSAILIDASDCRVLYEKNAGQRRPMASTTKIMTALVALEAAPPEAQITVPAECTGVEGSSVYLTAGEKLTLRELLYALLLSSANDAAEVIAVSLGGSVGGFSSMMNEKAAQLGLTGTSFENPHGLDGKNHYTTAHDLALLTAHAMKNPLFCEIVSSQKAEITGIGEARRYLSNHNRLLRSYEGAIGVKTGFTKKSGRCLVSAAERGGLTLIAVTLNAPDDWNDHRKMLDFGFEHFVSVRLSTAGECLYEMPVVSGEAGNVLCETTENVSVTLPVGAQVTRTVECPRFEWKLPENGEVIGKAVYSSGGKVLYEAALTARVINTENKEPGFWQKLLSALGFK